MQSGRFGPGNDSALTVLAGFRRLSRQFLARMPLPRRSDPGLAVRSGSSESLPPIRARLRLFIRTGWNREWQCFGLSLKSLGERGAPATPPHPLLGDVGHAGQSREKSLLENLRDGAHVQFKADRQGLSAG